MQSLVELRASDNPLRTLPDDLPPAVAALPLLEKIDLRWVANFESPAWFPDLEARGCLVYR